MELIGVARSPEVDRKRPRCADCAHYKFYEADPVLIYGKPSHRCTKPVDLVTSKTIETDCYAMRHIRGECGPDARLFEDASGGGGTAAAASSSAAERGIGLGALLFVLGVLAVLALTFWGYDQQTYQPKVIKTGEVTVKDGSKRVTARTRLLTSSRGSFWQFEASPGEWKSCGENCEKALRKALAK